MPLRRGPAACLALTLPLAVAACSGGGEDAGPALSTQAAPSSVPTESERVTETTVSTSSTTESTPTRAAEAKEPKYSLVSPAPFMDELGSNANIAMELAGTPYFCTLGAAAVACSATPDDSVPNLEDMPGTPWAPFTGRPQSIFATADGIMWGVVEGGTPGSGELQPGERLEYLNGWCQVPDEKTIECGYDDESFTTSPGRTSAWSSDPNPPATSTKVCGKPLLRDA